MAYLLFSSLGFRVGENLTGSRQRVSKNAIVLFDFFVC